MTFKLIRHLLILLIPICLLSCLGIRQYHPGEARSLEGRLRIMTSQLVITGFYGQSWDYPTNFLKYTYHYPPGGLLLRRNMNIANEAEFRKFTAEIKKQHRGIPFFLCIDEEGGRIHFFKDEYGFNSPAWSARKLGRRDDKSYSRAYYDSLAVLCTNYGINFNFGPVADLDINPDNPVIGFYSRSYSSNPAVVMRHCSAFLEAFDNRGVLCSIKHYPGHGSSDADSHSNMTDVSGLHHAAELDTFIALLHKSPSVMVGHLVNTNFDTEHPATLSRATVHDILRIQHEYDGLIITDALDMRAISDHYTLAETACLAIEAGNDILLTGSWEDAQEMVGHLLKAVESGRINRSRIRESYRRIMRYKKEYGIVRED